MKRIFITLIIAYLIQISLCCFFDNVHDCQLVDSSSNCPCPCIPKCCPEGEILARGGSIHGLQCIKVHHRSNKSSQHHLFPDIPFTGKLHHERNITQDDLRFYGPVLPACYGISEKNWQYEVHNHSDFRLNADFHEEYVLHIRNGDKDMKMISNLNNDADRGQHDDMVVGLKPLMFFCFDRILSHEQGNNHHLHSVAVTCPKSELAVKKKKIYKCCPTGHTFTDGMLKNCSRRINESLPWNLAINGHLYSEDELIKMNVLEYRKDKSLLIPETAAKCDHTIDTGYDAFHIGPDGFLHFTDIHLKHKDPTEDFCVEQLYHAEHWKEADPFQDVNFSYGSFNDTSYSYYDYSLQDDTFYDYQKEGLRYEDLSDPVVEDSVDSSSSSTTEDYFQRMNNYDCHNKVNKPHNMIVMFCYATIVQIRKCCARHENLNLRTRSCSTDLAKQWNSSDLNIYKPSLIPGEFEIDWDVVPNIISDHIYNMRRESLHVSEPDFKLLVNESLFYNGRIYNEHDFCLDYSFNYCDGTPSSTLRAIINDPQWKSDKASSIFGTNKEDSAPSLYLKRIGYPITIFFLLLTLCVFLVIRDLRRNLHGKMVICIATCQLVVYVCLFIGTFPSYSVSKFSKSCIAQASVTYYCILCGFGWMSAMSYNIFTKFRTSTLLPKDADRQRFQIYSAFCFGFPLILFIIVVSVDRYFAKMDRMSSSLMRPGFGEESCWFTSCSEGLSIFLYGPVCMLLLFNVVFFVVAAHRLGKRRKGSTIQSESTRVSLPRSLSRCPDSSDRHSRLRSFFKASSSVSMESDVSSDNEPENLRQKFIRQVSSMSGASTATNRKKNQYLAHKESFLTYLKLFVMMGLTWCVEVLAWILAGDSNPAPQAVIIILNLLNIFQGPVMFMVFTMKPATADKLRAALGFEQRKSRKKRQNFLRGLSASGQYSTTTNSGIEDRSSTETPSLTTLRDDAVTFDPNPSPVRMASSGMDQTMTASPITVELSLINLED